MLTNLAVRLKAELAGKLSETMFSPYYRVLFFGHDYSNMQNVFQMLTEAQDPEFEVLCENELPHALARASAGGLDAILWDLTGFNGDALEALKGFCSQIRTVPVIVLVPENKSHLGRKAVEMGAAEFLSVEIVNQDLLQRAVRYEIDRHRAANDLQQWEGQTEMTRGPETILVVEDDEPLRGVIKKFLTNSGYKVLEAGHGDDALRLAQSFEGAIHLLLTDVVMPKMSGKQLAEQVRRIRPLTKILYMSGYPNEVIAQVGPLASGVALIEKPFTRKALLKDVRQLLDEPPQSTLFQAG
jgi:DNA-binding response OmpR family regulator